MIFHNMSGKNVMLGGLSKGFNNVGVFVRKPGIEAKAGKLMKR